MLKNNKCNICTNDLTFYGMRERERHVWSHSRHGVFHLPHFKKELFFSHEANLEEFLNNLYSKSGVSSPGNPKPPEASEPKKRRNKKPKVWKLLYLMFTSLNLLPVSQFKCQTIEITVKYFTYWRVACLW